MSWLDQDLFQGNLVGSSSVNSGEGGSLDEPCEEDCDDGGDDMYFLLGIFSVQYLELIDLNGDKILDILHTIPEGEKGVIGYSLGGPNLTSAKLDSKQIDVSGYGNPLLLSLANAGDLNEDGADDCVIGSPAFEDVSEGDEVGSIFLLYGGRTDFNGFVDKRITAPKVGNSKPFGFGYSVRPAGDFDGDGFRDLFICSAELMDGGDGDDSSDITSRAFLLHGSDGLNSPELTELSLPAANIPALLNVHPIGDVNGDGFEDVIVTQFAIPFLDNGPKLLTHGSMLVFGGKKENLQTGLTVRVLKSPNGDDSLLFGSGVI